VFDGDPHGANCPHTGAVLPYTGAVLPYTGAVFDGKKDS
jgi:hypothetical protein